MKKAFYHFIIFANLTYECVFFVLHFSDFHLQTNFASNRVEEVPGTARDKASNTEMAIPKGGTGKGLFTTMEWDRLGIHPKILPSRIAQCLNSFYLNWSRIEAMAHWPREANDDRTLEQEGRTTAYKHRQLGRDNRKMRGENASGFSIGWSGQKRVPGSNLSTTASGRRAATARQSLASLKW